METTAQTDIQYEQVLSLAKQLPRLQKIRLSRELEKEEISMRLSELLEALSTDEFSLDAIKEEVEIIRQRIDDLTRTESNLVEIEVNIQL
jgi:predicted DNA-binding protein YlxM (UPF0122 family)